ncbi:MAG: hypothetical protein ACKVQA_08775 [Burkholderiales bacterium]
MPSQGKCQLLLGLLLGYGTITVAQSCYGEECNPPTWVEPSPGTTITEARPRLAWIPHPDVKRHQLRITSRVPEGEVNASLDTVVESDSFLPPSPLTSHRAKVTVAIKPMCDTGQIAEEQIVQFYIDTSASCKAGPPRRADAATMIWPATTNALGYEIYLYQMPEGRLAHKVQLATTHYTLPESLRRNAVLVLHAHCPSGYGDLQYVLLN